MDMGEAKAVRAMLAARPIGTAPLSTPKVASGPQHVFRISTADASDCGTLTPFGMRHGRIVAPPLYDPDTRVLVAHDPNTGK